MGVGLDVNWGVELGKAGSVVDVLMLCPVCDTEVGVEVALGAQPARNRTAVIRIRVIFFILFLSTFKEYFLIIQPHFNCQGIVGFPYSRRLMR